MAGRALSAAAGRRLWAAWTPAEVAEQLTSVTAPWYVAAGWAVDLFIGGIGREHDDIEIGVPRERFDEVTEAFPSFEWDVVGEGWIWPFPEEAVCSGMPLTLRRTVASATGSSSPLFSSTMTR